MNRAVLRQALAPLAAFLLGAAAVLGFAPVGLAPLPVVSAAGLLWLWQQAAAPRRAAALGFAFGLGLFLAGVSWVYVSLHEYGAMPAPLAALATLLFCAVLALYPALAGYLQARFAGPIAARQLLLIPALWVFTEWLRDWVFTGFPWLTLGYSQADSPLRGYAPITGVFGLSWLVWLCAALLLALLRAKGRSLGARRAGADPRAGLRPGTGRMDPAARRADHSEPAAGEHCARPQMGPAALRRHGADVPAHDRALEGAAYRPARDRDSALSRFARPRARARTRRRARAATAAT